jgi:uncharacterized protein DUF3224
MGAISMKTHAQTSFQVKGWDENTWDGRPAKDVTGAKLTRADVKTAYDGDIKGEGHIEYLMAYCGEGASGSYVGLEQVTGSIGGKAGSFVFQHQGTFDNNIVKGTVVVVPDSGTGELAGLRGTGVVDLGGHEERFPLTLDYDFGD